VTTYVYQTCGKEFNSLDAAQAELSRVLGREVTDAYTLDVTTMEDAANGREIYIVCTGVRPYGYETKVFTPDDTQEADAIGKA
jgi:hypothetical protein